MQATNDLTQKMSDVKFHSKFAILTWAHNVLSASLEF